MHPLIYMEAQERFILLTATYVAQLIVAFPWQQSVYYIVDTDQCI